MILKNLLKQSFKRLIHSFFFSIYGRIENKGLDFKKVSIEKIKFIDKINVKKFNYKLFHIKEGRVFTNFVENVTVISNNKLLKDVSFQQIKGHLSYNKNEVLSSGTPKFKKKFSGKILVLAQGASGHFNYAHWLFDIIPK